MTATMTTNDLQATGDLAIAQMQNPAGNLKLRGKASLDVIDRKSKEFEGVFMAQMLQPMFEGLKVDPLFGGGHGEEVMRSFLIQEYGKAMAASGTFGIAAAVKNAMIRSQEIGNGNIPSASQGAAYAPAR